MPDHMPDPAALPPVAQIIELRITFDPTTGAVNLNAAEGVMDQRLLVYGLLDMARDIVHQYATDAQMRAAAQRSVQAPRLVVPR